MSLNKEKQIIIKSINEMGRRVSGADIASKTGLPISITTRNLNEIASETSGHLLVSSAGDIAYQFPLGYQTAYLSRGVKLIIEKFTIKTLQLAYFLLRISFGIMLILSLIIIVLLFFLVVSFMSRGRDDRDDNAFNIDLDFFDWIILRDLFYWQIDTGDYNWQNKRGKEKSNFLYDCFSFLFGDGNPNKDIEERKWQAVAQLIRQQKGVITIEQLAPYTGDNPDNEDNALPILVRFDGRPAVTNSGNIVYLFPALQVTAVGQNTEKLTSYLKTFPWQFSKADNTSLIWVAVLAGFNFLGSWYIYFKAINILPSLTPLLLTLVIYGSLFVLIPFSRYLLICFFNNKIEKENSRKKYYAEKLTIPEPSLNKKLDEAKQKLLDIRQIKSDNIVYDTQKDLLEQEFSSSNNS